MTRPGTPQFSAAFQLASVLSPWRSPGTSAKTLFCCSSHARLSAPLRRRTTAAVVLRDLLLAVGHELEVVDGWQSVVVAVSVKHERLTWPQ